MGGPGRVQLAEEVVERCLALGFALAGVCEARGSDHARALRDWLAQGKHGSMEWLARDPETRADPARVLEGARSIVMVADRYAPRPAPDPPTAADEGRIARYARGRDYHKIIKRRLHALCDELRAAHEGHEFRAFVDTAPVLEREHALRAGLGWIGKHTLLIHPRAGSYLLLGGVLTTLELTPPPDQPRVQDHCGTCTRCIDACPTDAITPYSVDASRCISYLTIEHRGEIDPSLHDAMADPGPTGAKDRAGWLFGCDICQEVCPHNSARPGGAEGGGEVHPAYEPRRHALPLLDVLGWDEAARREAVSGTAATRAKLPMLQRNALILAGAALRRGDQPALRAVVERLAADADADPLVRSTANQVLGRIRSI